MYVSHDDSWHEEYRQKDAFEFAARNQVRVVFKYNLTDSSVNQSNAVHAVPFVSFWILHVTRKKKEKLVIILKKVDK